MNGRILTDPAGMVLGAHAEEALPGPRIGTALRRKHLRGNAGRCKRNGCHGPREPKKFGPQMDLRRRGKLGRTGCKYFENCGGPVATRTPDLYRVKLEVETQSLFGFMRLRASVRSN